MKVLLLATGFNGMCQRVHRELVLMNHTVSVELALSEAGMEEAALQFEPDIIICPFLTKRIPTSIWQDYPCLIVHPGIEGDRGASSLDWAITGNLSEWGVTLLQAAEEMDAGDIWGTQNFPLRAACKSSIYKREVTQHTIALMKFAIAQFQAGTASPRPLDCSQSHVKGQLNPTMAQADRQIEWLNDNTDTVIRKIHASDGVPGVLDTVAGEKIYLYGARREEVLVGKPGTLLAQDEDGKVCLATNDGAVWIRQLKRQPLSTDKPELKLPAMQVLVPVLAKSKISLPVKAPSGKQGGDVYTEMRDYVAYVHFDFYNGAMNTLQCVQLRQELVRVKKSSAKVIVLMGGEDFWSNGIHLHCIEAVASPADESWANINAIDDVVAEIINTPAQITVSALRNNAGAGGAIMALACDKVVLREGVVLNPHYQTMGLYGSEYWTYLLPKRVGWQHAEQLTQGCMPLLAAEALAISFADELFLEAWDLYHLMLDTYCSELASEKRHRVICHHKQQQRAKDEKQKPLQQYRNEELAFMHATFYDLQSEYHQARRNFVYKVAATETPERIAWFHGEASGRYRQTTN